MNARSLRFTIASIAACACALAFAGSASATVFPVDDLSDVSDATIDGVCDATGADTCTLRAALEEANNAADSDVINLTLPGTITLVPANGQLISSQDATVNGHPGGTTIDAGAAGRVLATFGTSATLNDLRLQNGAVTDDAGAGLFTVATLTTLNRVIVAGNNLNSASGGFGGAGIGVGNAVTTLVLNDSTISGNTVTGLGGLGGGIRTFGPLTVNRSTISGNSATLDIGGRGGGIDHNATSPVTLTITNSTISGNNSGGGGGGGIFATLDAATTTVGSTIAGNTTTGNGGGIRLAGSNATLSENTIYAFNTSGTGSENCGNGSAFATAENNIDTGVSCAFGTGSGNQENVASGALGLGALASNGGPTQTHSIASGSVARNAASADCGGLTADQRGTGRPQGASCDIGAFELEVAPPPTTGGDSTTPTTLVSPTPPAPPTKKCKKGQKLKKGKCVKKKAKKK